MILVTGGTGFIGKVLVRQLVEAGHTIRVLIRPSPASPALPTGFPLDVTVSSFSDERSLRSAMVGVDTVYHLAGVERHGAYGNLMAVDIQGTRAVVDAAIDAGVDRFIYLSHLGADRSSAYPVFKAKAIGEEIIRRSGLDYTIFRSAIVYGPGDSLTTGLARLLHAIPFSFIIPGDGQTLIQPIWIEDLVTCLVWTLEKDLTRKEVFEMGGPEYLPFRQVVELVLEKIGIERRLIPLRPPYLRILTVLLESLFPTLPVSVYWLDYLAANRTCSLDTIPRVFELMPSRMVHNLDYLRGVDWGASMRQIIWSGLFRRSSERTRRKKDAK